MPWNRKSPKKALWSKSTPRKSRASHFSVLHRPFQCPSLGKWTLAPNNTKPNKYYANQGCQINTTLTKVARCQSKWGDKSLSGNHRRWTYKSLLTSPLTLFFNFAFHMLLLEFLEHDFQRLKKAWNTETITLFVLKSYISFFIHLYRLSKKRACWGNEAENLRGFSHQTAQFRIFRTSPTLSSTGLPRTLL